MPSLALVALAEDSSRPTSDAVATALRTRGIACEVAKLLTNFGKQIRYAERRDIPYVWFPGADGGHEIKDIRSGEQVVADPDSWAPEEHQRSASTTQNSWRAEHAGDR